MPNWCDNTINISGDKKTLKNLKEFVGRPIKREYAGEIQNIENPVFSFYNIIAPTKDATPIMGALSASSGDEDWYHNQINSWGTKWDVAGNVSFSESDDSLCYSFDSAWSPPEPVIARLAEIFPTLCIEHKYYEPGCDFWGIVTYQKGEVFEEEHGDMNHSAWVKLGMDCYQCEQYEEDPEEYEEYLYKDCPPAIELAKKAEVSA